MRAGQRSLNLSNAVAVTVFEAWRQNGFSVDAAGRPAKNYVIDSFKAPFDAGFLSKSLRLRPQ